jgi:hypothetical protein
VDDFFDFGVILMDGVDGHIFTNIMRLR